MEGIEVQVVAIDCDYARHLLVNYVSKTRLIFKKITDANNIGNSGNLWILIFLSRIAETKPKLNTTLRWFTRNASTKNSLGQNRQIIIALTASASPHHFNSQAAKKPMIARAAKGEV